MGLRLETDAPLHGVSLRHGLEIVDARAATLEGEVAWVPLAGSITRVVVVPLSCGWQKNMTSEGPGIGASAVAP